MSQDGDWRLVGQERYLTGARLRWARYQQPKPHWDHDHCAFCMQKIMEGNHPDTIQEAYVTEDGRHWVCPVCVGDFRQRFGWVVISSPK